MKLTINQQVRDLISSGALFVSNHSGGKDSQAMLIELLDLIPKSQLLVVHASLGKMEWAGALELARDQAAAAGVPFIVARASKSLFDMVEHRYATRPSVPSWPSSSSRQCTSDLKRDPIQREVRRYADLHGFTTIVNCLGLRAQESTGRAKKLTFKSDTRNTNSKRTWFEWLPMHEWVTLQIFARIASDGQQHHYAYDSGNERLSCVFCIMGSRNDLANGGAHRPELLAEYHALETKTGYTMHQSRVPLAALAAGAL